VTVTVCPILTEALARGLILGVFSVLNSYEQDPLHTLSSINLPCTKIYTGASSNPKFIGGVIHVISVLVAVWTLHWSLIISFP